MFPGFLAPGADLEEARRSFGATVPLGRLALPNDVAQAALGDEVDVPTPEGPTVKVKVPPGTQTGRIIRLHDRGVPHLRASGRGDLLACGECQKDASLLQQRRHRHAERLGELPTVRTRSAASRCPARVTGAPRLS